MRNRSLTTGVSRDILHARRIAQLAAWCISSITDRSVERAERHERERRSENQVKSTMGCGAIGDYGRSTANRLSIFSPIE